MPDNNSRVVPTPAPADLPTKTILVNGTAIAGNYSVLSVAVSHMAHKVPEAQIVLLDGDVSTATFEVSNSADFIPGVEIEIKAGYHGQEDTIFKGMVVKQAVKILQGQSSVLNIVAKHDIFKTTLNRKNASFKDKKDSEVIESLITGSSDVDATTTQHKHLLQSFCTDWDFINLRAEANGMFVLPKYDKIQVKAPVLDAAPVLSLYYGSSILEFEAEMDARNSYSQVKVSGWSASDQKVIDSTESNQWNGKEPGNFTSNDAANAVGNSSLDMFWQGDTVTDNLDTVAKAAVIRHHLSKTFGRAQCIGFATIWPGDIVELNGVGDRFNGKAYVTGVHHSIREGKWDTDIQFGWKNKSYAAQYDDVTASPALGYMPGINGLQIGIVNKLESDPLSEFRVLIQLPTLGGADEAIWARMATLDAGKDRGSYFRPEIGDEVVVGFIDNNPLHAVIVGCMHSSKNSSPITPADANQIKGFYSREKMRWQFDDDKKEILFDTPKGNKILISEDQKGITLEDENGNKVVMNDNGIEITSSKDFKIKANGDISVEGTNSELKANSQFKASGGSGAELSSSSTTIVRGSTVNIN
ncbi:type VI secretion system tip protein VgrG [Mucilaginibacter ginsenosidivorans]|uniref:Type VI secretion system tip protein VgrG n=1 Tax=Mucilaginibacter ginsenosidivorans TaxID=398053 RepID=A0A5B8UX31_9SPHI|nr:type VI secretion system tip protein VgrG [Mucilaginibacter ginsenosidivorans]QEC63717.1 type VI secretion system tip protein VgrG [Mucilaginibacter ginsenosidivorans]